LDDFWKDGLDPMTGAPMTESKASAVTGDGSRRPIRRALISVYDKTGVVELAVELASAGVALVSTGRTAAMIAEAGAAVTPVADVTDFPEILDGRVKTLHPRIHGGLLADTRNPAHLAEIAEHGIEPFDLVISNLYPFTATVESGASVDECVEQIDIGGPSMIRAAAKNYASVAVVTDPSGYDAVRAALRDGGFSLAERARLATQAFQHTASYDVAVAGWMNKELAADAKPDAFPDWTGDTWQRVSVLRYGENPHQKAALYRHGRGGLATAEQLHGKEMSYNNYVDTDAAWQTATAFADPAVAIMKHANPCGIAVSPAGRFDTVAAAVADAHRRALACDPVSAFGGVIAVNRPVSLAVAEQIAEVFTEVVLAPAFDDDALAVLTRKKNIRILRMPADVPVEEWGWRHISGGVLAQTVDRLDAPGDDPATWTLASGAPADADTLADLAFAWRACRSVKSNAILLAHGAASVGIGMGQVNRVDSCALAVGRAGDRAAGSVAASDAFFPFADGPQTLIDAGVRAIVQPGGSVRDSETIEAAAKAGITMYLTGTRHFLH
jgi:phosphoribosylaminoimidazolecarboxamide formyltransferase/IMP cyclohydrolase